jgi:hypothetical protein
MVELKAIRARPNGHGSSHDWTGWALTSSSRLHHSAHQRAAKGRGYRTALTAPSASYVRS